MRLPSFKDSARLSARAWRIGAAAHSAEQLAHGGLVGIGGLRLLVGELAHALLERSDVRLGDGQGVGDLVELTLERLAPGAGVVALLLEQGGTLAPRGRDLPLLGSDPETDEGDTTSHAHVMLPTRAVPNPGSCNCARLRRVTIWPGPDLTWPGAKAWTSGRATQASTV